MSTLIGRRFKEQPSEATLASHVFLLRGGYVRQIVKGIYSLLPPAKRITAKIERIIREEMDRIGGQEVLMPVALPAELWQESGRYESVGAELVRFRDRTGHDMILGMTHEEAVLHLCRSELSSHKQLPFMVYQIQTKFRDEPRSRGGLIRVREFTMKDAYSFHSSQADLERYYELCLHAYKRIFARAGISEVAVVQSDSGMMGGKVAHEFMLLCEAGEDTIACCDGCGYCANNEVATGRVTAYPAKPLPLEKVATPEMKTIDEVSAFLGVQPRQTAKVIFYDRDSEGKPVMALIRGDREINEIKLAKIIRTEPVIASEERAAATGAVPGFASPLGISPAACRIVVDHTIVGSNNLVCGANEPQFHLKNFNLTRDLPGFETVDIARCEEGDGCPSCQGAIRLTGGIETGNIFQLGTKYTDIMKMRYLDEQRAEQIPVMGCYGIGVGRLLSSVIEARHDKFGPIWPISIAPWHVHLNGLNLDSPEVQAAAEALYQELLAAGVEVLYDDRNERPGVQFAEADLLGLPFRFIVSERTVAAGKAEWKRRGGGQAVLAPLNEAVATAGRAIEEAFAEIEAQAEAASTK